MVPVMSGPLDGALTVAGEPVSLAGGTVSRSQLGILEEA